MIGFAKRNIQLFFRDKAAVFFSLLSVLIIIGLYALFLGDVWAEGMEEVHGVKNLMNHWIMAGLLTVTGTTTTMGAFGTMVEDRSRKIEKDFYCSPVSRASITGGYILSAFAVGCIMSVVAFLLAEVYILLSGGALLDWAACVKVFGIILLSTAASTAMVAFIVSFFQSQNGYAAASTVVGTMIGFLTGIYLPVGTLPGAVQTMVSVFPLSHSAALFRQVFMQAPLQEAFAGAPAQAAAEFEQMMGVRLSIGGSEISLAGSLLILGGTAAVFFLLAIWRMSKKRG